MFWKIGGRSTRKSQRKLLRLLRKLKDSFQSDPILIYFVWAHSPLKLSRLNQHLTCLKWLSRSEMNRTRIVVSTLSPELASPRFDDEATIVSARPVVPLARVKTVERSRMSFLVLAGLLAAGASGAFAAFGVNYYENRRHEAVASSAQTQSSNGQQPGQQVSESQSALPSPSDLPAGGLTSAEPPSASATAESTSDAIISSASQARNLSAAENERVSSSDKSVESSSRAKPPSPKASETASDPGRLIRKRRVLAPAEETPPPRTRQPKIGKRGAGLIQEIFGGRSPN